MPRHKERRASATWSQGGETLRFPSLTFVPPSNQTSGRWNHVHVSSPLTAVVPHVSTLTAGAEARDKETITKRDDSEAERDEGGADGHRFPPLNSETPAQGNR